MKQEKCRINGTTNENKQLDFLIIVNINCQCSIIMLSSISFGWNIYKYLLVFNFTSLMVFISFLVEIGVRSRSFSYLKHLNFTFIYRTDYFYSLKINTFFFPICQSFSNIRKKKNLLRTYYNKIGYLIPLETTNQCQSESSPLN